MLDKQTDINWSYIHASNECAENDGRPIIVTWGGCNLNEIDSILNRLDKDHMLGQQTAICFDWNTPVQIIITFLRWIGKCPGTQ
jgi:hypothetical protein